MSSTKKASKRPLVVSLIGRPNVGKSSLFNRLMGKSTKAITHDMPGVTRDRHYGIITLETMESSHDLILVDTGGFYPEEDLSLLNRKDPSAFFPLMKKHGEMAMDESDIVLFVVDVREGPLPFDNMIAQELRKRNKSFALVINKYDSDAQAGHENEFYQLGVDPDQMFLMSAAHGRGTDDIKDWLKARAEQRESYLQSLSMQQGISPREEVIARVALIGAPNAGKSTLLNHLLGTERALVSDIPGTTADPVEGYFDLYFGQEATQLREHQFFKTDSMITQNYEEFRKHNADLFDAQPSAEDFSVLMEEDQPSNRGQVADQAQLPEGLPEIDQAQTEASAQAVYEQLFTEEQAAELTEEPIQAQDSSEAPTQQAGSANEDTRYWRSIHLLDTAGIRRKSQVEGFIETQSVFRSLRCISESDVIICMVDGLKGISHQDRRLLDIALDKGKSVIVALNKIDLLKDRLKDQKSRKQWLDELRINIPWLDYCDLIPISAKEGKGIKALKQTLKHTILRRKIPVSTGELNRLLNHLTDRHPLMLKKVTGKSLRIKYAAQVKGDPPTFLLFANSNQDIPENYNRYLRNGVREFFGLKNTPIHLIYRKSGKLEVDQNDGPSKNKR